MKSRLHSEALVILSQLQHTKTEEGGMSGQFWDPRYTWAVSCLDHLEEKAVYRIETTFN